MTDEQLAKLIEEGRKSTEVLIEEGRRRTNLLIEAGRKRTETIIVDEARATRQLQRDIHDENKQF